jgi:hypothetical protein
LAESSSVLEDGDRNRKFILDWRMEACVVQVSMPMPSGSSQRETLKKSESVVVKDADGVARTQEAFTAAVVRFCKDGSSQKLSSEG